ncbi:MAG: hypothetical protein Q9196_002875 [Gyalolechia fulgens]
MRQRGAGTRDIVLAFDLELPGVPQISKTPLRPQKSSRSRKELKLELQPLRSTRKTPKSVTTKATLLSKRTPAITRPQRTKATTGRIARDDTLGTGSSQHDVRGSITTKRKRKATEDITETQAMAPPKKQRKKRSIGQPTLEKKPRADLAPSGPVILPRVTPGSRQLRHVEVTTPEATAGQRDDTTNKPPGAFAVPDADEKEEGKAQIPEKRRKRKSIGQTQRGKVEPTVVQPGYSSEKADLVEGAKAPTKAEDSVKSVAVQIETKAKPRKRKRKAIAQSPRKRKKILSLEKPQLVPKEVEERRKSLRQELGIGRSMAVTTIEEATPKSIAKVSLNPRETAAETTPKGPEPDEAAGDLSPAEAQPQAELDLQAPKRKGKKRKPISHIQRPRKRRSIDSMIQIPLAMVNMDPNVESVIQAPEATTAPEWKRKGHLEKPHASIAAIADDRPESEHDHVPSLQAPRKRGRPKKATISGNLEIPVTADASEHKPPQELRRKKRPAPALSTDSVPLPQGPDILISEQIPAPQPPPNVKKRGRPKKQDSTTSIAETNVESSKSRHSQAKSGRSAIRAKPPSARIYKPPAKSLHQKPVNAARVIACARDDEDDDDPLSDLAPPRPRPKLAAKQIKVPRPPRKHLRRESSLPTAKPISTRETCTSDLNTRTIPTNSREPPAQDSQENRNGETATTVTAALATQLRASRREEKALRQDLLELQAQQANEIAEQNERDIAARLEALSASVTKRKLECGMKVVRNGEGDLGKERRVGKGLENFVFRTVKKRKIGGGNARAEEEDIDPELQELLSQVKGVEGVW